MRRVVEQFNDLLLIRVVLRVIIFRLGGELRDPLVKLRIVGGPKRLLWAFSALHDTGFVMLMLCEELIVYDIVFR